jgi:hypothetical protein
MGRVLPAVNDEERERALALDGDLPFKRPSG